MYIKTLIGAGLINIWLYVMHNLNKKCVIETG